ncbi:hypothetical protein MMPV_008421 [Pyropia vietnamensis]
MAHVGSAAVGTTGSDEPVAAPAPPNVLDGGGESGSDSDGISPARSGDVTSLAPPSPAGTSMSASSSTSSSSSESDEPGDGAAGGGFRRLDSDDDGNAVGVRLGRFTRGIGGVGAPGRLGVGVGARRGWAVGGSLGGGSGGSGRPPRPAGANGAAATAGARAGRLAAASKARVRDALLAHDPGGYKRALADKHALEHIFSGLDSLGVAVHAARSDGRDDVAFVLDDDRRNARRALDEALAMPDEAAALDRIRAVEAAIEASLEVAAASAEEAAAARAAAHAALPMWKRVWDLDKDGVVSLKEKRHWVTGILLLLTAIGCLVLMALLTKSYVDDHHHPSVVLSVTERTKVVLPPFTFCMPGPAFATIDRLDANGGRIAPYTNTFGKPLFIPEWVQLPTPTGGEPVPRDNSPFNPVPGGFEGELIELAKPRLGCANANASLSPYNEDACFSCYEMWRQHSVYGGGTVEQNLQSTIDVAFRTYAPYAACLADPKVLKNDVVDELRAVISDTDAFNALVSNNVLRSATEGTDVAIAEVAALTSEQLCNVVFFSGVFYPLLLGEGAAYVYDGSWTLAPDVRHVLEGRHVGAGQALDLHILPAVSGANTAAAARQATQNEARSHASLPGFPVGAALPGELTQVLLTKRIYGKDVQGPGSPRELRYEARVDGYPRSSGRPAPGYHELIISIGLESFLVEDFERNPHYSFVQFLEQITGYTANFFDISVFTLIVVPILFAFHKRDKAREEALAAAAAADAADANHPSAALGSSPVLTPLAHITPGASSFYRRRRLPSAGTGIGGGGSRLGFNRGDGSFGKGPEVGAANGGLQGSTSLTSELAGASSGRSLGGWILRYGAGGGSKGDRRQEGRRTRPPESSDDDVV